MSDNEQNLKRSGGHLASDVRGPNYEQRYRMYESTAALGLKPTT